MKWLEYFYVVLVLNLAILVIAIVTIQEFEQAFPSLIYNYQALIIGVPAVIVGWGTVAHMRRQLAAQKEEAKDRRDRRARARRAVMPADLSSLIKYLRDCSKVVGTAIRMLQGHEDRAKITDLPSLPDRVVKNFQDLIEELDNENANAMADLLSCYQVQHARLDGEIGYFNEPTRLGRTRVLSEQNIEHTIDKTVELYLLAENMLPFARRAEEDIPPPRFSEDDVSSVMIKFDLSDVVSRQYQIDLQRRLSNAY